MGELLFLLFCFFKASFSGQYNVAFENLALRQQLVILKRTQTRPAISTKDRLFWVWLSRIWSAWRSPLLIVKPDTVIGWHRKGFRLF
jgi:putative transposase